MLSEVGSSVADRINNVYEDYRAAQSNKLRYGLINGVRSFTRPSTMKKLTKDYGGLHPRLKLKENFGTKLIWMRIKKIKQLLNVIQNYAPLLSKFVPGLSETMGMLSEVGSSVADGINNVYEDYTTTQSNKQRYGFMDGVRSFTRPSTMKKLMKDYGGLHPRLKLKENSDYDSE
jgi:hypothetical protein